MQYLFDAGEHATGCPALGGLKLPRQPLPCLEVARFVRLQF